jgi:hypothetical protein
LVGIATFVLFALLAVLIYLPAGPFSTNRIPGGGFDDPPQLAWFLAWVPYSLEHGLNIFHTNYVDYPTGINLATNTSVPLLGLIATPITLTLGPIAAVNFMLHLAFTLSAGSMYLVLRSWSQRWISAFAGGLLYGFSPYMIAQAQIDAHLDLLFVPLLPIIVWCAYELVVAQRRSPTRLGLLLGVLAGAQALIDPELLSELAVLLGIGLLGLAITHPGEIRPSLRNITTGLAVAFATFFVLAGALLWGVLFGQGHLSGPVQEARFLQDYRADLLGPVVPTSYDLFAPSPLAARADTFVGGNISENATYLGLPLLLVLGVIGYILRRRWAVRVALGLGIVSFIFSLGSRLTVDAHSTSIPLTGALTSRIPILDNFLPARFAVFVTLFGAIVLAFGIDYALDAALRARRRVLRFTSLGLAGAVSLAALLPHLPLTTAPLPWPSSLTSTLRAIPSGSVVLTYPYPITPWSGAMLWQAEDAMRFKIIGGYATVRTTGGVGNSSPNLMAPFDVQEVLLAGAEGPGSYYPQPPAVDPHREQDLCRFIQRYSVNAVVFWNVGADPTAVEQYFSMALGTPSVSKDGVLVWLTGTTGCHP